MHEDCSVEGIRNIGIKANEANYYSVLLTYHSLQTDLWVKSIRALDENHKFKYMIALRTYSMAPEYFVMIHKSLNQFAKDRFMFNIVAGDLHKNEMTLDNLLLIKDFLDDSQKRVDYTYLWLKKVKEMISKDNMPEIVMSGTSEKTLNYAAEVADYNLCMSSEFIKNPTTFFKNKNRIVASAVVIRNSYEEAEAVVNKSQQPHEKQWTLYGTENQVLEKMKELKNLGATDLMIRNHSQDKEPFRFHNLVKKYNGEIL